MNKDYKKEQEQVSEQLTDEELDLLRQSIDAQKIDRSQLPPHDNSDKAKAIRFSTLDAICSALDCNVEDILEFVPDRTDNT